MKRSKQKPFIVLIFFAVTIALLILQTAISVFSAHISDSINYSSIDPYNVFARVSVHHFIQMLIGLAVIFILKYALHQQFYMNFRYSKIGVKYTLSFAAVFFVVVVAAYIVEYFMGVTSFYSYPLTTGNVIGSLAFQLFLSGPSEEILFRALPITVLDYVWGKNRSPLLSIASAAILFSIAHINWSFSPFQISFDNWFQLIYCVIFGMIYGITYIKSKSILYPMILHSLSNILMFGIGYLYMTIVP